MHEHLQIQPEDATVEFQTALRVVLESDLAEEAEGFGDSAPEFIRVTDEQ